MNNINTGVKIAFFVFAALIVIFLLIFFGFLPGRRAPTPPSVVLEFWNAGEPKTLWNDIISSYIDQNEHVAINYREINEETYEEYLINSLAEGTGPDIFV